MFIKRADTLHGKQDDSGVYSRECGHPICREERVYIVGTEAGVNKLIYLYDSYPFEDVRERRESKFVEEEFGTSKDGVAAWKTGNVQEESNCTSSIIVKPLTETVAGCRNGCFSRFILL